MKKKRTFNLSEAAYKEIKRQAKANDLSMSKYLDFVYTQRKLLK